MESWRISSQVSLAKESYLGLFRKYILPVIVSGKDVSGQSFFMYICSSFQKFEKSSYFRFKHLGNFWSFAEKKIKFDTLGSLSCGIKMPFCLYLPFFYLQIEKDAYFIVSYHKSTSRALLLLLLYLFIPLGTRTYVLFCPHSGSPAQTRRKCLVIWWN